MAKDMTARIASAGELSVGRGAARCRDDSSESVPGKCLIAWLVQIGELGAARARPMA